MVTLRTQVSMDWAKRHPDKVVASRKRWLAKKPQYLRQYYMRREYNLTLEQWEDIFNAQGRVCALCSSPEPGAKSVWHMDHDHVTGRLRGILCYGCNNAVGVYQRRIQSNLDRVTHYLEGAET